MSRSRRPSGTAATAAYDSATKTLTITGGSATTAAQVTAAVAANASASAAVSVTSSGWNRNLLRHHAGNRQRQHRRRYLQQRKSLLRRSTGVRTTTACRSSSPRVAAAGAETAAYNSTSNTLTITANAPRPSADIATAINAQRHVQGHDADRRAGIGSLCRRHQLRRDHRRRLGSTPISQPADQPGQLRHRSSVGVNVDVTQQATQANLTYSGGALASTTVLQVGGDQGYQVLNFGSRHDAHPDRHRRQPDQRRDRRGRLGQRRATDPQFDRLRLRRPSSRPRP